MVSPAFTGMFFAFAGMTLLLFASVSPPAWNTINFLQATANGVTTNYGVLGYCQSSGGCSGPYVGYNIALGGATGTEVSSTALNRLTYALVLHPVAGALALFSFLFGLFGVICASRFMTVMMALSAAFAALVALAAFVIDMVIWILVRNTVNSNGFSASLGNANWLTVGSVVALFLAFCTATCGAFGRFATGRSAGEKY